MATVLSKVGDTSSTGIYKGLEVIAVKKAQQAAGSHHIQCSVLENAVHYFFNNIYYFLDPSYEEFYDERMVECLTKKDLQVPPYQGSYASEAALFVQRFMASPSTIGSIFPSSAALINSITSKISPDHPLPRRILEIGAGTGPFTVEIVAKMNPNDHLDVVEYDAQLCKLLKRKFRHLDNVTIHHISILDFSSPKYDVVVSGLPLNSFTPDFVESVLAKYRELTKPDGTISYFEYIALEKFKLSFLSGEEADNFQEVLDMKSDFVEEYGESTDEVYWNITPARVLHCRGENIGDAASRLNQEFHI